MADDNNDYFDGDDIEEKANVETPEQRENREIASETIEVGRNEFKHILYIVLALIVLSFAVWIWFHYFNAKISEAQRTGRVMEVKCEGTLFKTYEGELVPEEYLDRNTKIYQPNFTFSIDNDSLARKIMSLQRTGKKVTLKYKQYRGVLPWRGDSRNIAIGCDVDSIAL